MADRPVLRTFLLALAALLALPMAIQLMPPIHRALEVATTGICWHPGMARNASFATEQGCE